MGRVATGRKQRFWGFTLIEVLASLVIIGVVLMIAIPRFSSQVSKVNELGDAENVKLLQGAVKQFKLDTGNWPGDLQFLVDNPGTGIPGWQGPYLKGLPQSLVGKTFDIEGSSGRVLLK